MKTNTKAEPGARHAPLEMDADTFRALGHRLVDRIATGLESIPEGPLTRGEGPSEIREALGLGGGLPEMGMDPGELLDTVSDQLFRHSLFNAHPRFFGYITAPPAPIGILGDLLASALNPNMGAFILSPAATEIERETVRWIAELIGYPSEAGGLLVSGGNMANFACFLAAREARVDWDVRAAGLGDPSGRPLRVYGSGGTHTWIQKAADMSGMGTDAVRWIQTDAQERMDIEALARQIAADRAAGTLPFMVVGTGGSVSTGAVDPLPEIAALCRDQGIWFHVDGAYGALAAATDRCPPELLALTEADSVAVDPHKWLYAPLEAGCALVRDPEALRNAFSYHPPYYHFGVEEAVNFVDLGPQNSRGFRALKVWLALRQVGREGYRRMISDDIALSEWFAARVDEHPELERVTQALSITTYRYVPEALRAQVGDPEVEEYLNTLNREVQARMERGGEAFVSNAVIEGRYLLRACIVNFHTQAADMDAVAEISARLGREVHAERNS